MANADQRDVSRQSVGLDRPGDVRPGRVGYVDVDFARLMRSRNSGSGLGLDMADIALQMTPINKVAAATLLASKLPVVRPDN